MESRCGAAGRMERELEAVRYRADGALLLGASTLSGRSWLGSIWLFKDPFKAPNEKFCTVGVQTQAGVVDACWVSGREILLASDSGAVELWEVAESEGLMVSKFCKYEHDDVVTKVSVLSGETQAVSSSLDCSVKVWDLEQKTVLKSYQAHSGSVMCVAACPSNVNLFLSCAQDRRLLLWDRRNSKPALRIDVGLLHCCPTTVTWHPQNEKIFAFGTENGIVGVKSLQNQVDSIRSSAVHSRTVSGLQYSSHSSPLLASVSEDCTLAVVDANLSEVFRNKSHKDFIRSVSWSPLNSNLLSTAGWDHQVLHHTISSDKAAHTATDVLTAPPQESRAKNAAGSVLQQTVSFGSLQREVNLQSSDCKVTVKSTEPWLPLAKLQKHPTSSVQRTKVAAVTKRLLIDP